VEIQRQTLTRVEPDGHVEVIAELGGGPNGAAVGPDGAVYIANNGGFLWAEFDGIVSAAGTPDDYTGGFIQRVDLNSGRVDVVLDAIDGKRLKGPNDLVFDRHGGLWFTDMGKADADRVDFGSLCYATIDGKVARRVREGFIGPNGVGLSPDGSRVYVAETQACKLWAYAVTAPGAITQPTSPWAPYPDVFAPGNGFQLFDSMAVEANGNICVATIIKGGITVFAPGGGVVEHVAVSDPMVTNICFGGPDMRSAWITSSGAGQLLKCRWPRPGLTLPFNA